MRGARRGAVLLGCAAAAIGIAAAPAAAPSPAAAIAARQANFKEISGAFKSINDELKAADPDAATILPLARTITARSQGQLRFFPAGSGPEAGVKTRAMAAIWRDKPEFTALMADLGNSANSLQTAAARGDVVAIAAARTRLGESCKACHAKFRESE